MDVQLMERAPVSASISRILNHAEATGRRPQIAQQLVRATLGTRFPNLEVEGESIPCESGTDATLWRCQVGSTWFYVVEPVKLNDIECIWRESASGLKTYVLSPVATIHRTKLLVDASPLGKTAAVESVEDFVGSMIDRLGKYETAGQRRWLESVINEYNVRLSHEKTARSLKLNVRFQSDNVTAATAT